MRTHFEQGELPFGPPAENPNSTIQVNDIEVARQKEYRRCDLIAREFGMKPTFVLKAICSGWSEERARQEFFKSANYNNATTALFAS